MGNLPNVVLACQEQYAFGFTLTISQFIYGIIFAMSTKQNDETTPIKKQNGQATTQPSAAVKAASDPVKKTQSEINTKVPVEQVAEDTPEAPTKKVKRGKWILLGIAGLLVIVIGGLLIGYAMAIRERQVEELDQRLTKATTQYVLSLQDIEAHDLSMAKTRLEYVIQVYPDYPDAMTKLTEVMVAIAQENPDATSDQNITNVVATPDTRNVAATFSQAQQQMASQDWANLFSTVNSIRNTDPTYKSVQVDGMYYLALRNMAISKITNGNLETGIYYLTQASKIGPIDTEAMGYENRAIMLLDAGSGFGVNWERAVAGYETLYAMVPYMVDVNGITVTKRYAQSLAGYGDTLQSQLDWCGAVYQYEKSLGIMNLDSVTAIIADARDKCANPPPAPTPTLEPGVTPTAAN
jgi:hypothetical protein